MCWEDVMVALCPFWDPPLIIGHSEEDKLIAESLPSPSKKANRGTRWPRAAAAVRRATGCGTRPVSRASPPMNPAGSSGAMLIDRAASVSELRSGPRRRRHVGPPRARSVPGEMTKRGGRPRKERTGHQRTRLGRRDHRVRKPLSVRDDIRVRATTDPPTRKVSRTSVTGSDVTRRARAGNRCRATLR